MTMSYWNTKRKSKKRQKQNYKERTKRNPNYNWNYHINNEFYKLYLILTQNKLYQICNRKYFDTLDYMAEDYQEKVNDLHKEIFYERLYDTNEFDIFIAFKEFYNNKEKFNSCYINYISKLNSHLYAFQYLLMKSPNNSYDILNMILEKHLKYFDEILKDYYIDMVQIYLNMYSNQLDMISNDLDAEYNSDFDDY